MRGPARRSAAKTNTAEQGPGRKPWELDYFPATVVEAATAAIIFGNDSLI